MSDEQSGVLFHNKRFTVVRRTIELRDGRLVDRPIIKHPGSVAVLPLLDDGRVLLIENFRYAIGRDLLEVPAGNLEPGEPPECAARRELAEETGYRAERIEQLTSFYTSPGIMSERMYLFLATGLEPGRSSPEPGERITLRPTSFQEAIELVGKGTICDGKTILALLFWERFVAQSSE